MTRRRLGAIAAGAFAVGILERDGRHDRRARRHEPSGDLAAAMAEHMAGYDMGSMMSGSGS